VPQLRRTTTAKVIAHTRVTSRLGAHIGSPVDLDAQSDLIGVPEPVSVESVLADRIGRLRALVRRSGPVTVG
jgi:hypothetical protein